MIVESDYVVDIGPKAGKNGGEIISFGKWETIQHSGTLTADYLSGKRKIVVPEKRRKGNGKKLLYWVVREIT